MSKRQFPTTAPLPVSVRLWPGTPIEELPVQRAEHFVDDDGWFVWRKRTDPRPLEMEVVLRELLDVDVSDASAISAFVAEHGVISIPYEGLLLGVPADASPLDLVENEAAYRDRDAELRRAASERYGRQAQVNHARDVQRYLWQVQRCARMWIAHVDGEYVWPIWFRDLRQEVDDPQKWVAESEAEVWNDFAEALTEGLKRVHARVEVEWKGHRLGEPEVGLFSALCIQLYNVIVEGSGEIRTCANETCKRRFIRQRGGAVHGQHRSTGVIYCTVRCAKTQGQRELRRRKKEQS